MPRAIPAKRRGRRFATSRAAACFSTGARPIKDPGDDGLVNTDDDGADQLSEELFTREIDINTLNFDGTDTVNPNLREVTRHRALQGGQRLADLQPRHLHLVGTPNED